MNTIINAETAIHATYEHGDTRTAAFAEPPLGGAVPELLGALLEPELDTVDGPVWERSDLGWHGRRVRRKESGEGEKEAGAKTEHGRVSNIRGSTYRGLYDSAQV